MTIIYKYLIHITFVIVLSIIFFVFREQLTRLDLYSYGFILFAYFISVISPVYTKNHLNKTVSDLPVYAFCFAYLLFESIFAIIVHFYNLTDKTYTVTQTVLTGIFLISLFIILYVNKITENQIENFKQDSDNSKNTRIILEKMVFKVKNNALKDKINELIEIIKTCPIKSTNESLEIENDIFKKLNILYNSIDNYSEDVINQNLNEIKALFLLRNNILKH